MAKSLGQIHSVNSLVRVQTAGQRYNVDLPGELTRQLQRMIRAGNFFKLVGIDLTVDGTTGAGGSVSGHLRYYAPTRGRCAAFRGAFQSVANMMNTQGVSMRENPFYDFRVPLNELATINTFNNQATLDGTNGLVLDHTSIVGRSVFGVHNKNVKPQQTAPAGTLFNEGFDTLLQGTTGTDFVLNDAIPFTGDPDFASEELESIPFSASWSPGATDVVVNWNWRPDPALYVAIMCGQIQVEVEDLNTSSPNLDLNFNFMVSGWKSIMGNPDKKPRRRSKKMSGKKKE
ncbi:MAG: hypothetical protein [Circular genetic element sp.]|nr:MAG: hypothetical protein [Circular genetic element sp.]